MHRTPWVVIITGEDRPGILDDVCGVIQRNSGHIHDLRSIDVGGYFAMLLHVDIAAGAEQAMEHQLTELASYSGMRVSIKPAISPEERPTHVYRLTACGTEHLSVLKKISHLMRVLSVNIDHIETHTEADGNTMMSLALTPPRDFPVSKLREFVGQLMSTSKMQWDIASA